MLERKFRLRAAADFKFLYRRGRAEQGDYFKLLLAPNRLSHSRAAVVISTRVAKRATRRNRLRRRLLGELRALWPQLKPGFDLVIVVRSDFIKLSPQKLKGELKSCLERLGVLN